MRDSVARIVAEQTEGGQRFSTNRCSRISSSGCYTLVLQDSKRSIGDFFVYGEFVKIIAKLAGVGLCTLSAHSPAG